MRIPLPDGAIFESTTEAGVPAYFLEVTEPQARELASNLVAALGEDEIRGSGDPVKIQLAAEHY